MSSVKKRKSFILPPETPSTSFVHLNDDDQETAERRNLRREKSSDTPAASRPDSILSVGRAKLAKMTASEKLEHTEKCIQLSAANKISSKNAFSLLLIDQMLELVKKEEANFQVASTHLDASAKIYAARVDKVHADVLRFAGGLASKKPRVAAQDAEDDDEEAGNDEDAVGADGVAAPVKPKKKRRALVIQKDNKVLKSSAHLRAVNIGDLYLQTLVTSQEASEPGNCHFLLTLPVSGDRFKMQLRGDDLAFSPACAETPSDKDVRMPDFRPCLSLPLLPTEIHQMLVEGDAERTLCRVPTLDLPAAEPDEDDLPVADFGDDDFADDDAANDDGDGGAGGETVWMSEEVGAAGRQGPGGGAAHVVGADPFVPGTRLLTPQDYMQLHRAALGLSMGPKDWKPPRCRPSNVIRPAPPRRVRNRAPTEVVFVGGAAEFHAFEASTHTGLSEGTVIGWRRSTHLLPATDPDKGKRFLGFSIRKRATPCGVEGEEPTARGANDDDGPQVVDLDSSYTNFVGGADSDDHDDHDIADMDDAEALNAAAIGGTTAAELAPLNYAKRAKGIDMRMLKRCTWEIIRHNLGDKENAGPLQETTLTEVYNRLPAKLSSKMAANLSPALAFMSVLHLGNEHNLSLTDCKDLTELYIRKG